MKRVRAALVAFVASAVGAAVGGTDRVRAQPPAPAQCQIQMTCKLEVRLFQDTDFYNEPELAALEREYAGEVAGYIRGGVGYWQCVAPDPKNSINAHYQLQLGIRQQSQGEEVLAQFTLLKLDSDGKGHKVWEQPTGDRVVEPKAMNPSDMRRSISKGLRTLFAGKVNDKHDLVKRMPVATGLTHVKDQAWVLPIDHKLARPFANDQTKPEFAFWYKTDKGNDAFCFVHYGKQPPPMPSVRHILVNVNGKPEDPPDPKYPMLGVYLNRANASNLKQSD